MHDWRPIRRLFCGACLIAGPVLFFLGILVPPAGSDDTGDELLAYVRGNGTAVQVSDLMLIAAVLLLVPAFVGAMHVLRNRAPLLGYLGGGLAAVGFVCLFGMITLDGVALEMAARGSAAAGMGAMLDQAPNQDLLLWILTMVFVAGHIVGTTLLGIGLFRTRFVPVWAAVAVAVSQPLHFVAHGIESKPLDVVAFALFAAGLATLGVRVLRMRDAEWEAQPADPGRSASQTAAPKKQEAMA
jgi:hypothetical protein